MKRLILDCLTDFAKVEGYVDPEGWAKETLKTYDDQLLKPLRAVLTDIEHNARVMNQAEPHRVFSAIQDMAAKALPKNKYVATAGGWKRKEKL